MDGKERLIVVEGLAEGALQRVQDIALQALTGAIPKPSASCRRTVHWHSGLRSDFLGSHAQLVWLLKRCLKHWVEGLPGRQREAWFYMKYHFHQKTDSVPENM